MQVSVSPEINTLLDDAVRLSIRLNNYYVGVEHVLEALLAKSALLPRAISDAHLKTLNTVFREVQRTGWRGSMPSTGGEVFYTPRCGAAVAEAARLADRLSKSQPSAAHLLLAIFADAQSSPSRAMDRLGMNRGELVNALYAELSSERKRASAPAKTTSVARSEKVTRAKREAEEDDEPFKPDILETVTRDLTDAARQGKIEPATGREHEMMEVLQILTRKGKNNVILVGEAGVGKTKVVEGLAMAGVSGEFKALLSQYRFLELNLGALMAGTKYRGALEEKLRGLLESLKNAKDTVLFIDEMHLIMGTGAGDGGAMDIANLLKPPLARGELRCIGATTLQEYRKFIEKDPAIERRFQMVRVEPLSEASTYQVLLKMKPSFEQHHNVRISKKALFAAITLTQRYMPNRNLPDKAIDVLDQACARYRLKAIAAKSRPDLFESDNAETMSEKVTPHDIRKIVSQISAIPIEEITAEERLRLSGLDKKLKRNIIGQDEAITKTVAAVKKSRAGLADPKRPEAVLLFLGPSGVGKTQLAKELADNLFGSPDHLVTFDMSEYIEEHSVSRLLGAPPGYIGSDEEGRLTGAVRNKPFSILLFDEIEKAHPRIFDILLPVFDEGRLKDSRGRDVSFRNCIIILTSNIGAQSLHRGDDGNFGKLMDELRGHFRPEFINRIDEIVPFYPLLFEDVRSILRLAIQDLRTRLLDRQIGVRMYQRAYEFLAGQGYNSDFGARELRRTVERLVINPISEMVLEGRFSAGDMIDVLMEDDKLTFRKGEPHSKQGAA
ncbi:MAG: ATP-dependent Clp protease ATP-binding subunit [Candidatus Hydrogenedentes bacterium]|nr:ATP-dependent Clp protease ATP-binding subunit [Candidatus Hydrogenedentota bacterium]